MDKFFAITDSCATHYAQGMHWNHQEQAAIPLPADNQRITAQMIAELRELVLVAPRFSAFKENKQDKRITFFLHKTKDHHQASIESNSHAWAKMVIAGLLSHGDCAHYTQHIPKNSYSFDAANSFGPSRLLAEYRNVIQQEVQAEMVVSQWMKDLMSSTPTT